MCGMSEQAESFLESIPTALIRWVEMQRPIPPEMHQARTFYEAARVAHGCEWERKIHKVGAIHTWMTIALIADKRTRPYVDKLITDKYGERSWIIKTSGASCRAMEALDPVLTKVSPRSFERKRLSAIESLQKAAAALTHFPINLPLRDLLSDIEYQRFSEVIRDFESGESRRKSAQMRRNRDRAVKKGMDEDTLFLMSILDMGRPPKNQVPDLRTLILAAKWRIASLPKKADRRHQARAIFIREMFRGLHDSTVRNRIAFLKHAVHAVFGELIDKRDINKTVFDLKQEEKASAKLLEELRNEYIASLEGEPIPDDMRSVFW